MLTKVWTIGIKVLDLEQELAFHRSMGNEIVLDETLEFEGEKFRIPLIRMGDKYIHIAEKMVYERLLGDPLGYGIAHIVYRTDDFERDRQTALASGARSIGPVAEIEAGFGTRRVAFLRSPNGWMFEIIEVLTDLVPEV